jgi:hypothetical protein
VGWRDLGRDLRRRLGDGAQCTCDHKSSRERAPNSRSFGLLNKVVAHLIVLEFSVEFSRYKQFDAVYPQGSRNGFVCFMYRFELKTMTLL